MEALWETIELSLWNVLHRPRLSDLADILLVAIVIYLCVNADKKVKSEYALKSK